MADNNNNNNIKGNVWRVAFWISTPLYLLSTVYSVLTSRNDLIIKSTATIIGSIAGSLLIPGLCFYIGFIKNKKSKLALITFILYCLLIIILRSI